MTGFALILQLTGGKEKTRQHSQLRLLTVMTTFSCGEDWDSTSGDPATSVVHQGQFSDRRAQQSEWGCARHAAHT